MANFLDENGVLYLWSKIKTLIGNKVDKVSGKGLSTNDYTTAEKNKLAGIANNANNYTHPTASGNKHIPSGGATGQILRWSADGTATWGADQDTKYEEFHGATSSFDGAKGLVPAPTKADQGYFLSGSGNWKTVLDSMNFTVNAGSDFHTLVIGDGYNQLEVELGVANYTNSGAMPATDKLKLDNYPNYSDLENTYAKKTDITGVYKYKGSVATADKLPTSGQQKGDVYNIVAASKYGAAGANVAWDGSAWDSLGEIFAIVSISNAKIDEICV